MHNPLSRRPAFRLLCAGVVWFALAIPGAARSEAGDTVTGSDTAPSRAASPAALGESAAPVPSLSDIDIDALLAKPAAAAATPQHDRRRVAGSEPGVRLRRAWRGLQTRDGRARLRDRLDSGLRDLATDARSLTPADLRKRAGEVAAAPYFDELQNALLLAVGVLLVGLLTLRVFRGKGTVAVIIDYPAELRGTFNVRISKQRTRAKSESRGLGRISTSEEAKRAKRSAGSGNRSKRTLVSRETRFDDLAARAWFVTIDGFLQPTNGEEVLATHFEEREIRCRRGHTVRATFDLHPNGCAVDVVVVWDRRPVKDALIAERGVPGSLRHARGGPVRIGIGRGTHTLVVGSADRVVEHALEIDSFLPQTHTVDLSGRDDHTVFTGCPPAVEPYLNGDISGAARALEREGQAELANLLLAQLHLERGQQESAARHFEAAGRNLEAAEIHRELANFDVAAQLFDEAGETELAAAMFRSAGDLVSAGAAYERANRLESASECYRDAGDAEAWINALERMGSAFEAARISIENGDRRRAIRSLQLVPYDDPNYAKAANLLVDAYLGEGHVDLAAQKIDEVVRNSGPEGVSLAACDSLADQLEAQGEYERALEMLEIVNHQDATYPNLATRIEGLRKRLSAEQLSARFPL